MLKLDLLHLMRKLPLFLPKLLLFKEIWLILLLELKSALINLPDFKA
jgi:hypothetical protein